MNEHLKIAVLEDDSGLNELIRRRLTREKHECFAFYKAQELIDWLKNNTVDLIVTDLVLPDHSGEELISYLKDSNINIPFIVATGQGSESTAVKLLKKGARDYLVKNSEFLDTLPTSVDMVWREIQLENLLEKARAQIYLQNETLSAVYEYSPNGILVLDSNDGVTSFNTQLAGMWKLSIDDNFETGKDFFRIIAAKIQDGEKLLDSVAGVSPTKKGLVADNISFADKNFELYSNPLLTEEKSMGRIWYFLDVTMHKKAMEAMEKAKLEAENNIKLRSRFFAIISHDIKAPLGAIKGFLDLLMTTNLDEKQKEYLDVIKGSEEHLLTLINDILDLSKIEHGAMDFHVQMLSIRELFETSMHTFELPAKEKGIQLLVEVDPALPEFMNGDLVRLKQIVFNITGNAVKFTRTGHVKISCLPEDKDFMLIKISDTGIGIEKSAQDAIFYPFAQADASITTKYGGTGLGLAVAKQLVEKMGGELTLESETGKGSCFTFTIPLDLKVK